ncbi:hypothetical protein RJY99_002058 [Vibrio vulnificus]|nr:hypothetical protein [Vibrio vulnificus]ELV8664773.1 hypothetical protein [Vibrio vulnificus]HAS6266283.1 hypothetical protein [Vibrio vulnificus]HDY7646741.1 hypothetical protein [Vibrio vulnificus]
MKVLKQEAWDQLPFPDWRARFFLECFSESLSVETPHFHQAKMMGVLDLAKEVLENIKVYEENDKGKGYLTSSLKELKLALERDVVSKNIFSDILDVFDDCAKNFSVEKFPRSLIIQLSILCKRIIEQHDLYFENIKLNLIESICDGRDIDKKETITEEIHSLTRAYVTFLLSSGYSPTYLFNKTQVLTRISNYNGRIYRDQVSFFFNSLDCKIRPFKVFFGIKTNKKETIRNYTPIKGVKIIDSIPEKHYTISTKTFSKFSPDFYFQISIEALDYVGASLLASEKIESEIDLLKTLLSKVNLTMHDSCYVDYKAKGHTYQRDVNVKLLNSLLTYDLSSSQFNQYINFDFRSLFESPSQKKIEGVLKNIRQVKESARLEQKLLSLWISLESLSYSGDDKSVISSVISFLPKLYAIQSIKQRVEYVLTLLSKYNVSIPDTVRERHNIEDEVFSKEFPLDIFYRLVTCELSAREVCKSINNLDFLYFRFYALYKIVSDKKEIRKRIGYTREDIEKQLYRIYQKRNNIVHVGFSDSLSHYAINHLSDYVNTLLLVIFDTVKSANYLSDLTLDDVILSNQLVVDNKIKSVDKNTFDKISDLEFSVII